MEQQFSQKHLICPTFNLETHNNSNNQSVQSVSLNDPDDHGPWMGVQASIITENKTLSSSLVHCSDDSVAAAFFSFLIQFSFLQCHDEKAHNIILKRIKIQHFEERLC